MKEPPREQTGFYKTYIRNPLNCINLELILKKRIIEWERLFSEALLPTHPQVSLLSLVF